jgi:hypothetical protein
MPFLIDGKTDQYLLAEYKKRPFRPQAQSWAGRRGETAPSATQRPRSSVRAHVTDWSIEEISIELAASGIQADVSSVYRAVLVSDGSLRRVELRTAGSRFEAAAVWRSSVDAKASDLTG